ncbi:MAG: hypothetical protein CM1200mP2_34120 [Planctomycetaceae bacterium]|nr:MAG: hypothetical protein CM1200mP2_34120 [Planctomycetaceae bacterium]
MIFAGQLEACRFDPGTETWWVELSADTAFLWTDIVSYGHLGFLPHGYLVTMRSPRYSMGNPRLPALTLIAWLIRDGPMTARRKLVRSSGHLTGSRHDERLPRFSWVVVALSGAASADAAISIEEFVKDRKKWPLRWAAAGYRGPVRGDGSNAVEISPTVPRFSVE